MRTLIALLSLSACTPVISGNGHRTTEDRVIDQRFDRIALAESIFVDVTDGDTQSVSITTDENLQREYQLDVRGGTLRIEARDEIVSLLPTKGSVIRITVPGLVGASVSGSGTIDVTTAQPPSLLELDVSGSGSVVHRGGANHVRASVSGSGDIVVDGEGSSLEADVSGSGNVVARDFAVEEAELFISGSGAIVANVTERVSHATVSGSGTIELYGGGRIEPKIEGSGKVRIH